MHNESDQPVEKPDFGRRRFTRAGVSGSVLLGSLASQPVLGAAPYHCTVSGQVSGNLSRPGVAEACVIGQGLSYWSADTTTWPIGFVRGGLPNGQCRFTGGTGSRPRGTNFNRYTPGAGSPSLIAAFFNQSTGTGADSACNVVLVRAGQGAATMLQVLRTTDSSEQFRLGRAVVVSLLNAASNPTTYPVTQDTIIAMFNATFGGGNYLPTGNAAVVWTRSRVIEYLESLYPPG